MGINQEGVVGDSAMVSVPSAATAKYAGLLTEDSTTLRDDSIPNKNAGDTSAADQLFLSDLIDHWKAEVIRWTVE